MSDTPETSLGSNYTHNEPDAWYRLRLFNYYRGSLALFFITVYLNNWLLQLIPGKHANAELFISTSVIYLVASLLFIGGIIRRKPGLDTQVIVHTLVDISCIVILMHATGGTRTALGMILIISISMTSLFLHQRVTILLQPYLPSPSSLNRSTHRSSISITRPHSPRPACSAYSSLSQPS